MPTYQLRVFVSATTQDLGQCREAASLALRKRDIFAVTQDYFAPDDREIPRLLRDKIASCDAVICLVGRHFGCTMPGRTSTARSYTQLEYDLAREFGKPIFIFFASDDWPASTGSPEPEELSILQEQHRRALLNAGHPVWWFRNETEVGTLVTEAYPRLREVAGGQRMYYLHPPAAPDYFAGREFELKQLSDALRQDSPAIITVIGMGGQGKTTLVYEATRDERGGTFAGAFWCTAYRGGFSFDMFLDEALTYLLRDSFDKRLHSAEPQRLDRLVMILQQRPVLIVIDGVERWLRGYTSLRSADAEAAEDDDRGSIDETFDAFLSSVSSLANGTHLILTTRARPRVLDNLKRKEIPVYENGRLAILEGLDAPAAVSLLSGLGVRGSEAELRQVAGRYANHPLALRVLAGYIDRQHQGDVQTALRGPLLTHGGELFRLLDESMRDLPHRRKAERFLCAAAHSIDEARIPALAEVLARLDRRPSTLLRRLRGYITGRPVPAVDSGALRQLAQTLARWQFVTWDREGDVARLHPLVRQYFQRKTRRSTAMQRAFAAFYAGRPIDPSISTLQQANSRRLAIEHALLAGDLEWCAALMFEPFLQSYSFSDWLRACGHLTFGVDILGRLSAVASGVLKAEFLLARSALLHELGRNSEALDHANRALALLDRSSATGSERQRENLARALVNRSNVQRVIGRSSDAVLDLDRAIGLFEEEPAIYGLDIAKSAINRGNALVDLGHWSGAIVDYDRAVAICRRADSGLTEKIKPLLAFALGNRGIVLAEKGELTRAMQDFREAIDLYEQLEKQGRSEFVVPRIFVQVSLGATARQMGQSDDASASLGDAIMVLQKLVAAGRKDVESYLALAWKNRAHVHLVRGNWQDALDDCEHSISIYKRLITDGRNELRGSCAQAVLFRAEVHEHIGDHVAALADYRHGFSDMHCLLFVSCFPATMFQPRITLMTLIFQNSEQSIREIRVIRGQLRFGCGSAAISELMAKWTGESDIVVVYLQRATAAVRTLWPGDVPAATAIIEELSAKIVEVLNNPNSTEAVQVNARQSLAELISMRPTIGDRTPVADRIGRLTSLCPPARNECGQ